MREFAFEMALCAILESERDSLVSRQLGASTRGNRIVDILTITPSIEFDARTRITPERIPDAAIAADVGTGRARYWRDCFDCHPDRARTAVERSVEIGFFERERHNGRTYVRQTTRYPDWFSTIRAIENKPDLNRPGDLASQLRTDVSLAVCDEVVLATESYVTGAHLNRIPEEVGVWRFDPETNSREVIREPEQLSTTDPGIEVIDERPAQTNVAVVHGEEKARLRRQLAERAYGKGWRVEFPVCPHVENREIAGIDGIPYCTRQDRIVRPADACEYSERAPECGERSHSAVDLDAIRDEYSPWVRDPEGVATKQVTLDRFE